MVETMNILDRVYGSDMGSEPFSPILEYLNKAGNEAKQAWKCFNRDSQTDYATSVWNDWCLNAIGEIAGSMQHQAAKLEAANKIIQSFQDHPQPDVHP